MKTAIRDDNPVVVIEDKMDYAVKGEVPDDEDFTIPFGVADVKRVGEDVTVVATSSMVRVAEAAAILLEADGISIEIVDPRTLVPLDRKGIVRSVEKTGRAIVVDEGHQSYGVTAEIAAVIADQAFWALDAPVKRLGAMDVPVPFSPTLEDVTVPTPEVLAQTARALCGK
jgi:pyruvate dehydrogenase E1 component beta subunit